MVDWILVFTSPLTWFAAYVANWMLVPGAHEVRDVGRLVVVDGAAIIIVCNVLAIGAIRLRTRSTQRQTFMHMAAVGLSALTILLIIAMALPTFMLPVGAEP